jgi:hypothetical protein
VSGGIRKSSSPPLFFTIISRPIQRRPNKQIDLTGGDRSQESERPFQSDRIAGGDSGQFTGL